MLGFCPDQNIGFRPCPTMPWLVKDGCLYNIDCRLLSHTEIDLKSRPIEQNCSS